MDLEPPQSDPERSPSPLALPKPAQELLTPLPDPGELGWIGRYRILERLGEGGMGVVFRAEDPGLGRMVAIKVIKSDQEGTPAQRERFLGEARFVAALEHDNVVPVWEVGEFKGQPYVVMPLLVGETLGQRLLRDSRLSPALVLTIARQVVAALTAAHAAGILHRDVKPDNVWLEERHDGLRVRLLDFGLAGAVGQMGQLTGTSQFVGTPAYLAPEQARVEEVDGRADLFSLGCMLYEMVTGQLPFRGDSLYAVILALETHQPRPPSQVEPTTPRALSRLIMTLLEKDRDRRPANARLAGEAVQAVEAELTAPPRFWITRPVVLALVVTLLITLHLILWLTGSY